MAALFARPAALGVILAALVVAGCSGGAPAQYDGGGNAASPSPAAVAAPPALSAKAQAGREVFNARCALCHGNAAAGSGQGPPLVHRIYEPGHHQDFAFRNAVRNGVMAHHWQFGNMPPVPGLSDNDIEQLICYVRELQRANGIFAGSPC